MESRGNVEHLVLLALTLTIVASLAATATATSPPPIYTFIDIGDEQLCLINTNTDQLIQMNVTSLQGWPYQGVADMQHSWITEDGSTIYVSTTAQRNASGAAVVAFAVNGIDWYSESANLSIMATLELESAGTESTYPSVQEVDVGQPIASWTMPPYTQIHGPTFRPNSTYSYGTTWTDSTVFAFNTSSNGDLWRSSFPGYSDFSHGLFFNPSGTKALGANYFYDQTALSLYEFWSSGPAPTGIQSIPLKKRNQEKYGAFVHYVSWLDDRFAFTATMQFGETSLTPFGTTILPPSVWLIDTVLLTASRVVKTAYNDKVGKVLLSASDIVIANGKLYIAEEDSLDGSFGDDGYVSIFRICCGSGATKENPQFVKRLRPTGEVGDLPSDFKVAHGLSVTPDEAFVFVGSYVSNYIIKIDTSTDSVVATWGEADNLNAPHGGFVAGGTR